MRRFLVLTISVLIGLAGCAGERESRLGEARDIAAPARLRERVLRSGEVTVLGFARSGGRGGTLVVYIEGDGRAWRTPWQPSSDPTPTDPVALRLAAADSAAPLLYLARPCQFIAIMECHPRLWTESRYAPALVEAYSAMIDGERRRTGAVRIALVGYSGGGAVAVLLAERRQDVAWLITVAGNLDVAAWTRLHEVEPLTGSLDPAVSAAAVAGLPQVHFVGADDPVVPLSVVESFRRRLPPTAPVRVIALPGFDHGCCWASSWPRLLAQTGFVP